MTVRALRWCGPLALALAQPGLAQAPTQYDPRDLVVVDPARSYIFYRTSMAGSNMLFLREARQEALEPDGFPAWSRWLQVTGQPRFTAGGEGSSYLRAVEPGWYFLYGNMFATRERSGTGVCMCMGSLRFEARAGEIVDLGEIRYPELREATRPWGVTVLPFALGMRVPARMAGLPRAPAQFHAAGKLPNYFGVEIDRHDAMPGVLAYQRDRVIDVRTGAQVDTPAGR